MTTPDEVISGRAAAAQSAAAGIMRFLMQPRDLAHAEACDFLAGNPTTLAPAAYIEAVQRGVQPDSPDYFRYGPPWPPATAAAAAALGDRLGLGLPPEDVILTRGASSGLMLLLRTLLDPGDEVMMMSPPWFFYEAMVLAEGGAPVKVPLSADFDLDPAAISAAMTERTRIVIINTPHNPSGRIYPEVQLRALAEALTEATVRHGRQVYLVSDEAYARILFDGAEMLTPAHFYPATFMLHTYSKTLLAPMQRAGYVAMAPGMPEAASIRAALNLGALSAGVSPDTGMQHAIPELEGQIIDLQAVQARRDRLVAALTEAGYDVPVPEAGFYLFIRCPIPNAVEFCERLAERHVHALPGEAFERPGYFRLSLTATDRMVERAIPIFASLGPVPSPTT